MTNVKNKRLSGNDRDTIMRFASKQVEATEDKTALDAAYERAADAIHAKIAAENPAKDMAVLAKYNLADKDACIYVSTGGYNYERFEYRDGDKRVILRAHRERGCGRQPIRLDADAETAFDEWRAAVKAIETERRKRLADFSALVSGTTTFNALAEVWPAVEALRSTIVGSSTALAVLSADTIDRIKSDPAFAMAEAA